MAARRGLSPTSVIAFVVVAALAGTSFSVLRQQVNNQETALLKNNASQLVVVLNLAVSNLGSSLAALGASMAATGNSPDVFASQGKLIAVAPGASAVVATLVGGRYQSTLAVGPAVEAGQPLPDALVSLAEHAGSILSSSEVLHLGGSTVLAFAVAPPTARSRTVVIQTSVITPSKPAATLSGPYAKVYLALYASKTAQPSQLISGSFGSRPLPGHEIRNFITVGSSKWLVLTSERSPLQGSTARNLPWLLLAAGLLVALLVGSVLEVLGRRRAFAEELVAQRTSALLESQQAQVRSERLAAVGEMATVIGHELRNPLAAATNGLYLARVSLGDDIPPETDRHLSMIERETNRAAALSEDLVTYMREREPERVDIELRAIVDNVLEANPAPAGVEVSADFPGVVMQADLVQLTQMLTNLVTNALQAMPNGGQLRIDAHQNGTVTTISVDDSGPGIDPIVAGRLFDPFFTTKSEGTGLGLAIVQRLAQAHGGEVSIDNGPLGGARAQLRIPTASGTKQ